MLATVVLVGGYLYFRLDDEVRRYAENVLASHYDNLDIKLGSARFEAGRGVVLRHLVISERMGDGQLVPLADVDEMQLLGQFDASALAAGKPAIEQIRIRSPKVRAIQHSDGSWNVTKLFPPPATGKRPAKVEVTGALVTILDRTNPPHKPPTLRDVSLTAECIEQIPGANTSDAPSRTYEIEGVVGGELAESFKFVATASTGTGQFALNVHLDQFELNSPLVLSTLRRWPQLSQLQQISGKANAGLNVTRGTNAKVTWKADFQLAGCRLEVADMPRALTQFSASGSATPERLHIQQAQGKLGEASITMALDRRGWSPTSPLALRLKVAKLKLDDSFAEMIPPAARGGWNRFDPMGTVSAEVEAQFDGRRWFPAVTVNCHDVSFRDREKFNHRLTGGTGKLRLGDQRDGRGPVLDIESLTALAVGTPVTINGSFAGLPGLGERRPLGGEALPTTGWVEVIGARLPINEQLTHALGEKVSRVVDSLDAKGRVSFRWRFDRNDPSLPPHTQTDLTFHAARLQFEKFPYPLSHIEGTAIERDGNWRFENLVSRDPNATREIRAAGTCEKTPHGHHLRLSFVGQQVPLDDTLRLALQPVHQEAWAAIRPQSGRMNFTAEIGYHIGVDTKPRVYLEVSPLPNVVSIEPVCFPYRLENVQGKIVVVDNRVSMVGLRAEHGQTVFETDGSWTPNSQGGWQLQFERLHVDRLTADYDLKRAAPAGIGRAIDFLKPVGSFSIHDGTVRFSRNVAGSTHLRSEWRVSLGCQQNDVELGVPLKSITGVVHLTGRHEGNLRFTAGQLDLDSVFWNGMQFTKVRGPLWVDTQQCRLGRAATERMNSINRKQDSLQRIEADLYGGRLQLDAGVQFDTRSRYVVDMEIKDCDLARMSTDYFGGAVDLSGTLASQATLNGMGRSLELLEGGGRVEIRDAKMYELPVMARLLKVLRNRAPDKTAFNGVDAQFAIDGPNIRFNELNLLGDAVSLYGKGVATFDRNLDLVFHSTVGRNDFNVPLLRSMIGQASANLLLIKVTGPVENAEVVREPLPAVNEFMEQLGGEGVATPEPKRGFWSR